MRKVIWIFLVILLLVAGFFAWIFLGPATWFKGDVKYLYIASDGATKEKVLRSLEKDSLLYHMNSVTWLGERMGYLNNIKPGKYKIAKGDNIITVVRRLRNGQQDPVNLVILKFRTREALSAAIGKKLECDSAALVSFMNNADSLKEYGVDTNTVMTIVFPDTYTHFWNTTPRKVFNKFFQEYRKTWTMERRRKARSLNLDPQTAYILASIIEEETTHAADKPLMASVYLNRLKKGMRLEADPTARFAARDFETRRIYTSHLAIESPYNTYRNYGLPPGPICTPSMETLDAVLSAPATDYIFFVAKSDFSGSHIFTSSYSEHLKYAKEYRRALDEYEAKKRAKEETE